LFESAKDRFLGVDSLGQHVPPCVWYGTTSLLIREVVWIVPCSDEWEVSWSFTQAHMVQEGPSYHILPRESLAFLWYRVLP
jgi:hypothetical protein